MVDVEDIMLQGHRPLVNTVKMLFRWVHVRLSRRNTSDPRVPLSILAKPKRH